MGRSSCNASRQNSTLTKMTKLSLALTLIVVAILAGLPHKSKAAEEGSFQISEFATIRWGGRDNTQLIRPNGRVEKLRALLERFPRPDGTDDRAYYMNIAANATAKEGFEVVAMTNDEIVMKRPVKR